eukprot:2449135-Pyramimonas_sp.AAC.1
MIYLEASDHPLVFVCLRCKHYTSGGQVRGLRRECCPLPLKGASGRRCSWKRITQCLHPKRDGVTVDVGPWSNDVEG